MLDENKIQLFLEAEGRKLIAQIQANMIAEGVNASGQTSDSLESDTTRYVDGLRFQITGNEAFNWIEGGRGATKQPGQGVLYGNILDWIFAKGIDIGDESPEAVAAKITKTIHNSGTLLHRLGETRDVFSSVFSDEAVDELYNNLQEIIGEEMEKVVLNHWSL